MFTIIGGDGKEYGPATVEQIRSWIAAGRANLETQARALGSEEWRRLGDYAEFAGPATPPPLTSAGGAGAFTVPVATPDTATGLALAERGTRLAAWFIDNIIAFIAVLPGLLALGASFARSMVSGQPNIEAVDAGQLAFGGMLFFAGLLIVIVFQVWMLTTRGQTIGKRLLSIRIVRFADNTNPGFVSAVLLRAIVPGLLGAVPYIGFLFTLVDICFIFRDDRRCIHDLIAGTKVVKAA